MGEMVIYKYQVPRGGGKHGVKFPKGAKLLTIQVQKGIPTVWAWVDPKANESEVKVFHCIPTGVGVVDDFWTNDVRFLGTVQDGDGFVWHYFEQLTPLAFPLPTPAQQDNKPLALVPKKKRPPKDSH
jgi:hypothetical protein